ncbi:MAG: hypothetical protein AB7U75_02335 [Hyphomicrobiaceae bacterium]
MSGVRFFLAIALVLMFAPAGALGKEKASFIEGTYATEEGCKKLAAIEEGGPRNVETAPEVLTADGFKGWEGSCEFTKVLEHEPGRVWLGFMVCMEGATIAPQSVVIVRGEGDNLEVGNDGDDQPEVYQRCDAGKGKTKP